MNFSVKISSSIVLIFFIFSCLVNLSDQSHRNDQSLSKPFHFNQATLLKKGFAGVFWDFIKTNQHKSLNLSPKCDQQLNLYSDLIDQDDQEALKLLTASSHLPTRFLESSYSDLDGYSQCLTIPEAHYCLASVLPLNQTLYPHWFSLRYNATIHIGFCLPTSCSQDDVDNLISSALKPIDWEKVYFHGCQISSTFSQRLAKANTSQKWSLRLLVGIIGLVLISSLVHHFGLYRTLNCFWMRYFAIQQTHSNLVNSHKKGRIFLLDQMRILISLIFLLVHYFGLIPMTKLIYMSESLDTITYYASGWGLQPVNSDWIYSGLIYVGGSAIALQLWGSIKPDTPFSTYVKLIIKRLLLYWPVLIVSVAMKIVLPLFGSGPIYSLHTEWRSNVCSRNFWMTLLHVNNYQSDVYEMCFPYFWSMAVEFHLYILALVMVYLYKTRPKIGITVNIIAVFIGLISIFWIFYSHNIVYRFAGYSNEHWSQVETFLIRSYTRTEAHIFTYSFSLLVVFCLILNPCIAISERAERLITIILTALVILQSYSPGIWNVWRLEGSPFWHATHALTCKIVATLGFAWIAFSVRVQAYNVMANFLYDDKKIDDNSNKIGQKETRESRDVNDRTPSTKFKMFYAASRATFFVHYILFLWYFSLKSKISFDYSFLADSVCLVILAYLAGLIFHYFVIGPFENIVGSYKLKKFGKFD